MDVSQRLLAKRKDREARDPDLQKKKRQEFILYKWSAFTKNLYVKDGKVVFFLRATQVHIRDLKDCVDLLLQTKAKQSAASAQKLKESTESFLKTSEECSDLRRRLRQSQKRLSV